MSGVDMFAAGAWDDRALVKGWNNQVKEYNKYHSLQRKGKKAPLTTYLTAKEIFDLEDLADKEELAEMGIDLSDAELLAKQNESEDAHMENDGTAYQAQQTESADVSLTDAAPVTGASEETDAAERQLIQEQQQQSYQHRPGVSTAPQAPPIPGPTFAAAPGQDDALRNMNMAWFYAGYYQCQFESQQRTARQFG